ncbi:porin family protein [Aestuariibaculum suncheonense]|uniref:PorT family protein n=1 Tax=Aestuariibaculum suncheonense TaxID=1028745 RepID=A0A8J6UIK3_9FLAO|nr:porin family protein [Aestuariibaculum suncheonense]MBD0836624.1 PorT family protein [Aestuariibaculum suncheonense]
MRNRIWFVFLWISGVYQVIAQNTIEKVVDSLYKEDQFYLAVTYNLFGNRPVDLSQNGFSNGLHLGFMKDMPLNKRRNVALSIGLGYSTNSFYHNLYISQDENQVTTYDIILQSDTYTKNKFSNHIVEMPIEFRWRTSTPEEYKFWRIYTGFKLGYIFGNRVKYRGDLGDIQYNNIKVFEKFQYGLNLSFGYNTWNAYLYYALSPIFSKENQINGESIDMNNIKIGLIFYIL